MPRGASTLRRWFLVMLSVGALGVATVFLIARSSPRATDPVDWAARQVVALLEGAIVPAVDFDRFAYRAPRTLLFHGLTLTAPDGTEVVSASLLSVELTEIPRVGRPVQITSVGIDRGVVRLLETREPDGSRGFRGLVPFARKPSESDHQRRLSDALKIRAIELSDCGLEYAPASGEPPMVLTGVTTTLALVPGDVWHTFDVDLHRGNAIDASVSGRVDLYRAAVAVDRATVALDLSDEIAQELPPSLQALLADHDVSGTMLVEASGSAQAGDLLAADLEARLTLTGFNIAFGNYRFPIDHGLVSASLRDGNAEVPAADLRALGGDLALSGTIDLAGEEQPAALRWGMQDVRLSELLRGGAVQNGAPRLAGAVTGTGEATIRAREGVGTLRGSGEVGITRARLDVLPFMSELQALLDILSPKTAGPADSDTASLVFTLRGPAVDFSSLTLKSSTVSARGEGVLWFDRRLDLVLNAGPVERVQDLLGEFGRIFGVVTDQLLKYRVRGDLADPSVTVVPFGVGATPDRSGLP